MTRQQGTGWRVTATTVNCPSVTDFATIMVQPDGTARCAYVNRHSQDTAGKKKLQACKWPECPLVAEFRQKALAM